MATILDQFGKPIDMRGIREPQSESGDSGSRVGMLTREFANHPGRGLTPAKLNQILNSAEQGDLLGLLDLADDMEERDGEIYSSLSVRKTAVINLTWSVEPPEGASKDEKYLADQAKEWVGDIPEFEEDLMLESLDGILKGFKPIEMWWEPDQGTLQPRFASRPQRWLTQSQDLQRLTFRDGTPYGQELRPFNWLLHQPRSRSGYPARTSLARVLALPYLFSNYAVRDLAELLEIYGIPLRVGKYPSSANDIEKRKLLQAVVQIGHNAAGIIPQGMEIDFESAATGNEKPFMTMIEHMQAIKAKVIVGQTLTSGEGKHGTQALGTVHNDVRIDILKSDAKRLASTYTEQLVKPMLLLNKPGVDPRRLPRFHIDVPEPEDLEMYANALPKLAQAGMRFDLAELHKRLRFPMADKNAEILKGPPQPAEPGTEDDQDPAGTKPGQPGNPTDPKADAKNGKQRPGKPAPLSAILPGQGDELDDLVGEATADWRPLLTPMVAPLLAELDKAVAAGESLAAFRARMPELLDQLDHRPQAEHQARTNFMARLLGESDIDLEGTTE